MEIPDNCQCYCYAIMSSLCFPCQVKIHLLHLTASPHGELIRNPKCSTPSRPPSPQPAEKERFPTPTRHNSAKTDCENCEYYMNFINKLTSGLCEEKILRMVCSNPCLVSTHLPNPLGGTGRDITPPLKPHADELIPGTNIYGNNLTHQKIPSEVSLKCNASVKTKADERAITNKQVPPADHFSKKKSEIGSDKKPSTPTNLMTTDKMLKRSFDSISKNRPTPTASRTPSPEKKRPVIDLKPIKTAVPKNDCKPIKNDAKTMIQSSPSSKLSKPSKNVLGARQTAKKEIPKNLSKSEGKNNSVYGKMKPKDAPVKTPVLLNSSAAAKKLKTSEPLAESVNTCNEEVCEFIPTINKNAGGGRAIEEMQKTEGKDEGKPGAKEKATGEFFEAALIMEFYQPPQLENRSVNSKRPTKPLREEYEDEPSNPVLGDSTLKQFCEKPKRNSNPEKQGADRVYEIDYDKKQVLFEQKMNEKQQLTEGILPQTHYTVLEERADCEPPEFECTTNRNKKPPKSKSSQSGAKNDVDTERRKSKAASNPKRLDTSGHRNSQSRIPEKDENGLLDHQGNGNTAGFKNPVRNSRLDRRDADTALPESLDPSCFTKTRQRYQIRENENQQNSNRNEEVFNSSLYSINGSCGPSPAKIFKESFRQSINNDSLRHPCEWPTAGMYMTEEATNKGKDNEADISDRKYNDGPDNILEAPQRTETIPSTSQQIGKDPKYSARDTDRNGEDDEEQCEETKKGRFSWDSQDRRAEGVIKKIREEIESEFRRKSPETQKYWDTECSSTPRNRTDKSPRTQGDAVTSQSDGRTSRPGNVIKKKSRSCSQRHSTSGSSVEEVTRVYPQFSEYMNPDTEGYKSKSAGNIVDSHSANDSAEIPPVKSRSERGSSKWSRGVCSDDKRVYYQTDSDGKCTSMVIGLPQDGRNSNPHIRINFNKKVKQETTCFKVDRCEQKNDYRDTGTQCDYESPVSPEGSRPATAKSSRNRVPERTSAKPLQSAQSAKPPQTIGHQQMFYNRPLMRRSFQ